MKDLRVIWLASYPKSGNTWIRFFLINLLYGKQKSTERFEELLPDLHNTKNLGELLRNAIPIAKTHLLLTEEHPLFARTAGYIYVMRNPIDVMTSNFNYRLLTQTDHSRWIKGEDIDALRSKYFDQFIEHCGDQAWVRFGMGNWAQHVMSWLDQRYGLPGIVVKYEDLVRDSRTEFERVCKFLHVEANAVDFDTAIASSSFSELRKLEEREIEQKRSGFFYRRSYETSHELGYRFMNRGANSSANETPTSLRIRFASSDFAPLMKRFGYLDD